MARIYILIFVWLHCSLHVNPLPAQLRGYIPPAARESARFGLLGGLREAREERLRREAQSATAAARTAAGPVTRNPNSAVNNNILRREPAANPIRYTGAGVMIRLPKDALTAVKYLVDDVENKVIRPGEVHILDAKGSFIVRYSRGVTASGRSFGESRYTISEGQYRFQLTESGWELYREADGPAPLNRLELAENFLPSQDSNAKLNSPVVERPAIETPLPAAETRGEIEDILPAPPPRSILEKPKSATSK